MPPDTTPVAIRMATERQPAAWRSPLTRFAGSVHHAATRPKRRDFPSGRPCMQLPALTDFCAADLDALVELNALRAVCPSRRLQQLEGQLSARFSAQCRLAVYGSLAPARLNHDQLQNLRGDWHSGYSVRGELVDGGWGAGLGYPALRWSASGPRCFTRSHPGLRAWLRAGGRQTQDGLRS